MAVAFPSLAFFQALQQRTEDAADRFEKLGYCDTTFGVRVGDELFHVAFEVYECTQVGEGAGPTPLDFVLAGSPDTWRDMMRAICAHGGADAAHTLNTLTHLGDVIAVEYDDAEGYDKFFRYMASLQEFFDQGQHVEVALD